MFRVLAGPKIAWCHHQAHLHYRTQLGPRSIASGEVRARVGPTRGSAWTQRPHPLSTLSRCGPSACCLPPATSQGPKPRWGRVGTSPAAPKSPWNELGCSVPAAAAARLALLCPARRPALYHSAFESGSPVPRPWWLGARPAAGGGGDGWGKPALLGVSLGGAVAPPCALPSRPLWALN